MFLLLCGFAYQEPIFDVFGRRLRSEPCAQFQLSYLHRIMRSGETPSRHPMHTDVKYWICPSYFTFYGNDTRKHVFQLFYSSFASLHFHRTTPSWRCGHLRQSIFIFILLFLLSFALHMPFIQIIIISNTYLNASRCMLFWAEEKCAIDKWISVKNKHRLLAQYARYATLLMLCQR